jgi:hypothetical protein
MFRESAGERKIKLAGSGFCASHYFVHSKPGWEYTVLEIVRRRRYIL